MEDYSKFQIILDVPAQNPELNFAEFASAFKDIIEGSEPRFSIGIFGGWGAGKTTLMMEILNKLDEKKSVTVPFSAWRYEKEEHLIIPLLDVVRDSLNHWAKKRGGRHIKKVVAKTAAVIGGVTESILRGVSIKAGIPKVLELSFDANKALSAVTIQGKKAAQREAPRSFYFASFESLKACFTEFHKASDGVRIVVFIVDLDRCLPESALEVLESMKLFFDFDGFVFVVGLDQQVVEWCIDNRYARYQVSDTDDGFRIRGADYIKKIFQVPFALPPVAQVEAKVLLQAIIENGNIHIDQQRDLQDRLRPHLEHLLAGGSANLRDIKRFLNSYTLIMKVHQGLDPDVVLALQTIAFTPDWREIFDAIRVHGEELIREIDNLVNGQDHCVGEIAPDLGTIPLSFERYLQNGAPGNVLLQSSDLTKYINLATSATATDLGGGSSFSFEFAELQRNLAKVRRAISSASSALSVATLNNPLREAHNSLQSMESHTENLGSLGHSQSLMNLIRDSSQRIERILNDIAPRESTEPPSPQVLSATEELGNLLTEISEAIRQLKARGRLGSYGAKVAS